MSTNGTEEAVEVGVPKDLECLICADLLENAVSIEACGHTFCSVCIRNHWRPGIHSRREKECPLCNKRAGSDVTRALRVNINIQTRVQEFKEKHCHPKFPSDFIQTRGLAAKSLEQPIHERMQSRNYSRMQKNGKRELIKLCKDYGLSSIGNEQDLVNRLRQFECMWNAELDTIYTPLTRSELVEKFKRKERLQKEQKSRDVMNGTINHSKHIRKLTSLLLNDKGNERNDKKVCSTRSGNFKFDSKFQENFARLISEGREHMKKKPGCPRRIYADDHIHDNPVSDSTENYEKEKEVEGRNFDSTHCKLKIRGENQVLRSSSKLQASGSYPSRPPSQKIQKLPRNPYLKDGSKLNIEKHNITKGDKTASRYSGVFSGHTSPKMTRAINPAKRSGSSSRGKMIYNPYQKKAKTRHDVS